MDVVSFLCGCAFHLHGTNIENTVKSGVFKMIQLHWSFKWQNCIKLKMVTYSGSKLAGFQGINRSNHSESCTECSKKHIEKHQKNG